MKWEELNITCLLLELQEELLIEDEGHSADLLHFGLSCGVTIDEVCGDGDGQFPSELLSLEAYSRERNSVLTANRSITIVIANTQHLFFFPKIPNGIWHVMFELQDINK